MLCTHAQGLHTDTWAHSTWYMWVCSHVLVHAWAESQNAGQRKIFCSKTKALNIRRWKVYFVRFTKSNGSYRVTECPFAQHAVKCQHGKAIDAGGSIKILLTCIHRAIVMALCGKISYSHTWLDMVNYLLALFTGKWWMICLPLKTIYTI